MPEGIEGHLPAQAQTVSGTVTASAGTNLDTSALAKEAGGNLAATATSTASTATSTATTATNTGTTATNTGTIVTSVATIATNTGRIPAQGQAAMAASLPVTIANNQTAVPVSGTFYQATQPVSAAALPLPTGAALESGGNLATLVARSPAQGSATSANSSPVVVASDQAAVPVKPQAATSGGGTPFHLIASSGVNNTLVKSTPGTLYGCDIANFSAAVEYVKFINKATAPSAGSETVAIAVEVPAASGAVPGRAQRTFPVGEGFSAGIALFTVTGLSNGNGGAVAANDLLIEVDYS